MKRKRIILRLTIIFIRVIFYFIKKIKFLNKKKDKNEKILETIEKKKQQSERENNNYSDIIDVDNSLIINNCTNNLNLNKSNE